MLEVDIYDFYDSIENEYKFAGKYGAKGEKRAKRKKATPEQMKRQNQWRRETKVRRLIKANFRPGDLWETLKYPKGTRKPFAGVVDDMAEFLRQMRGEYRKRGAPFRWVNRIEIGSRGGIHMHIIISRLPGEPATDLVVQRIWEGIAGGRVNHQNIYEAGGYRDLARYLTKQPDEEQQEQLSLFEPAEQKKMIRYSSSRNLVRPQPEKRKSHWRTMRRMIRDGIKPREGYYIDPESVFYGTNPFNGTTYLKYTECRIGTMDGTAEPVRPEWQEWPGGSG